MHLCKHGFRLFVYCLQHPSISCMHSVNSLVGFLAWMLAPSNPSRRSLSSASLDEVWKSDDRMLEILAKTSRKAPSYAMDSASYASLLQRIGDARALVPLKFVHAHIVQTGHEQDRFLANLLILMYGRCGSLEEARVVFAKMAHRNVFSFNLMIGACCQNGQEKEALQFFLQVQIEGTLPDKVTFLSNISACANLSNLTHGKWIHACLSSSALKSDMAVGNALVNMYGKCGSVKYAHGIFDSLSERDVFSWSALIAAYAQHGQDNEAFQLFLQMQLEGVIPNKITFISILAAVTNLAALQKSQQVHACLVGSEFKSDDILGTALVVMYAKCGHLECAQTVFHGLQKQNVASWNAMIAAYTHVGLGKDAYKLFQQMQLEGIIADKVTCVSLLSLCANEALVIEGKRIHIHIGCFGLESDLIVGNALINMYGKCGIVEDARRIFKKMTRRNVISWNSMAAAYAQCGQGKKALQLYRQMLLEGIDPDQSTFYSILSAFSHAGLVAEGCECFISMSLDQGIIPTVQHYERMVDLLGKAGQLDGAENLIKNVPVQFSASTWMTLLGACKFHLDCERGQRAAKCILSLDPANPLPSILLSNIYATATKIGECREA